MMNLNDFMPSPRRNGGRRNVHLNTDNHNHNDTDHSDENHDGHDSSHQENPPFALIPVGSEVSAKFKGAFCEAVLKHIDESIEVQIKFLQSPSKKKIRGRVPIMQPIKGRKAVFVDCKEIDGVLRVGEVVSATDPSTDAKSQALIIKIVDKSKYTVQFDDFEEVTVRSTGLRPKGEKAFLNASTIDSMPFTDPEKFTTPVMKPHHASDDDDDEDSTPKLRRKRQMEERELIDSPSSLLSPNSNNNEDDDTVVSFDTSNLVRKSKKRSSVSNNNSQKKTSKATATDSLDNSSIFSFTPMPSSPSESTPKSQSKKRGEKMKAKLNRELNEKGLSSSSKKGNNNNNNNNDSSPRGRKRKESKKKSPVKKFLFSGGLGEEVVVEEEVNVNDGNNEKDDKNINNGNIKVEEKNGKGLNFGQENNHESKQDTNDHQKNNTIITFFNTASVPETIAAATTSKEAPLMMTTEATIATSTKTTAAEKNKNKKQYKKQSPKKSKNNTTAKSNIDLNKDDGEVTSRSENGNLQLDDNQSHSFENHVINHVINDEEDKGHSKEGKDARKKTSMATATTTTMTTTTPATTTTTTAETATATTSATLVTASSLQNSSSSMSMTTTIATTSTSPLPSTTATTESFHSDEVDRESNDSSWKRTSSSSITMDRSQSPKMATNRGGTVSLPSTPQKSSTSTNDEVDNEWVHSRVALFVHPGEEVEYWRVALSVPESEFEESMGPRPSSHQCIVRYLDDAKFDLVAHDQLRIFDKKSPLFKLFARRTKAFKADVAVCNGLDFNETGKVPDKFLWTKFKEDILKEEEIKKDTVAKEYSNICEKEPAVDIAVKTEIKSNDDDEDDVDGNDDANAIIPKFKYDIEDDVNVFYGREKVIYQAKILKRKLKKRSPKNKNMSLNSYFVHYHNWNNRFNEWINEEKIDSLATCSENEKATMQKEPRGTTYGRKYRSLDNINHKSKLKNHKVDSSHDDPNTKNNINKDNMKKELEGNRETHPKTNPKKEEKECSSSPTMKGKRSKVNIENELRDIKKEKEINTEKDSSINHHRAKRGKMEKIIKHENGDISDSFQKVNVEIKNGNNNSNNNNNNIRLDDDEDENDIDVCNDDPVLEDRDFANKDGKNNNSGDNLTPKDSDTQQPLGAINLKNVDMTKTLVGKNETESKSFSPSSSVHTNTKIENLSASMISGIEADDHGNNKSDKDLDKDKDKDKDKNKIRNDNDGDYDGDNSKIKVVAIGSKKKNNKRYKNNEEEGNGDENGEIASDNQSKRMKISKSVIEEKTILEATSNDDSCSSKANYHTMVPEDKISKSIYSTENDNDDDKEKDNNSGIKENTTKTHVSCNNDNTSTDADKKRPDKMVTGGKGDGDLNDETSENGKVSVKKIDSGDLENGSLTVASAVNSSPMALAQKKVPVKSSEDTSIVLVDSTSNKIEENIKLPESKKSNDEKINDAENIENMGDSDNNAKVSAKNIAEITTKSSPLSTTATTATTSTESTTTAETTVTTTATSTTTATTATTAISTGSMYESDKVKDIKVTTSISSEINSSMDENDTTKDIKVCQSVSTVSDAAPEVSISISPSSPSVPEDTQLYFSPISTRSSRNSLSRSISPMPIFISSQETDSHNIATNSSGSDDDSKNSNCNSNNNKRKAGSSNKAPSATSETKKRKTSLEVEGSVDHLDSGCGMEGLRNNTRSSHVKKKGSGSSAPASPKVPRKSKGSSNSSSRKSSVQYNFKQYKSQIEMEDRLAELIVLYQKHKSELKRIDEMMVRKKIRS